MSGHVKAILLIVSALFRLVTWWKLMARKKEALLISLFLLLDYMDMQMLQSWQIMFRGKVREL